jgi:ABC-type Fe3+/spermidine/putrescine transport system ATPase subunit
MERGRIRADGTPAAIYLRPTDEFVARFIGETNIFRGRVERPAGDGCAIRLATGIEFAVERSVAGPGAEVSFCVRPESVRCDPGRSAGGWPARVTDVVYLGDTVKYYLELAAGNERLTVIAKTLASRGAALARGDIASIGWRPDDVWILPEASP